LLPHSKIKSNEKQIEQGCFLIDQDIARINTMKYIENPIKFDEKGYNLAAATLSP
jgi:hypothetical protein